MLKLIHGMIKVCQGSSNDCKVLYYTHYHHYYYCYYICMQIYVMQFLVIFLFPCCLQLCLHTISSFHFYNGCVHYILKIIFIIPLFNHLRYEIKISCINRCFYPNLYIFCFMYMVKSISLPGNLRSHSSSIKKIQVIP